MQNAGPGGLPETGDDHNERTVVISTEATSAVDPDCPLLEVPGHECANREWVERRAAGQPVLRPGSRCFEGDRYAISVETQARQASIDVLAAAQSLLAVMAEYGYLRGDCGVEAQLLADATGVAGFALSLAGWNS